jgi:hypothetical protein
MEWCLTGIGVMVGLLALIVWRLRLPRWDTLAQFNPLGLLRGCLAMGLLLIAGGIIGLAVLVVWGG